KKIGSPKIRVVHADAKSVDSVCAAASGCDVVIDLVLPEFEETVMLAALHAGAHYINTAFYQPFFDQFFRGEELYLDREFREAGLTAVLGCGMAPGFLNVMTRFYSDKMDTVDSIRLRLAKKKLGVDETFHPWNPGWAPKQALLDCAEDVYVLEDGRLRIKGCYSDPEYYDFPEPLGRMQVTHHAHEEPLSMPRFIGKGLRYCDFKYYVSPQPVSFVMAGLASETPLAVNGACVKPLDVLTQLLPKAGNAFFEEDPALYASLDQNVFVCMMIEMEGSAAGQHVRYKVHLPKLTAQGARLRELFGTSLINVALPAVIGAQMAYDAVADRGVISSECLDPEVFLERFLGTGIPYRWVEMEG
ncbi:MAG: saccharopine dehydrogenase NADP-binding domain-containing protein, partial [Clostridiales Family XIII bacterium]|nr:saccharopine dehydrogenase NADP-binding domain-containing protein [Clostridiales Family XIII bacterium]